MKISVILLAGGVGKRMGHPVPKQFILLNEKPIVHYSLEIFLSFQEIEEIILVCDPKFQSLFSPYPVKFALPGQERQHSVFNGLQNVSKHLDWVMVHDAARPFITHAMINKLFQEGFSVGAAAFAMPVKNTLKKIEDTGFVQQTIDRSTVWEIQTPQMLKKSILDAGFSYIQEHNLCVTDDISVAEIMGHPAKLILGSYYNIKITTREDLDFASWVMKKKESSDVGT